jgi:hypothetical protein
MPKGRPAHKPTEELRKRVLQAAFLGITHEGMARLIGVSKATLAKHYQHELDTAQDALIEDIGGAMVSKARSGDVAAQKYILGCRAGWKETQAQEISGPNGGPVENKWTVEFVNATPEGE